ncbi:hypothetical protein SBRCBS47491_006110 [Sporothrix bragantina]|uniref:Uncharacterized protein n=1 Tax=Sporothrix bragantina TaxID=671064 RepID=A0ABP0C265_9PEZI
MAKKSRQKAIRRWEEYYNESDLENWQRMVDALGIEGHYPSKRQCKKAIRTVYVNIRDFLEAVARNEPVPRHKNFRELQYYTKSNHRFYAVKKIESGSPLSALLRDLA